MDPGPFREHAGDLASGDSAALAADWSSFSIERVASPGEPSFDLAWQMLWNEFGARGEMERRDVIASRLSWNPAHPAGDHAFLYELAVVRRGAEVVAVRDHTAIVPLDARDAGQPMRAVVHLSHVLVVPGLRGSGLASWLRALPVAAARRCLAAVRRRDDARVTESAGVSGIGTTVPGNSTITLVAEMEASDGSAAAERRLRSYAHGGFRMLDPAQVSWFQPDFRAPGEIERTGVRPVPLRLLVRVVGREADDRIDAADVRAIIAALEAMFAVHVRRDHMDAVRSLAVVPDGGSVRLVAPSPGAATERGEERVR